MPTGCIIEWNAIGCCGHGVILEDGSEDLVTFAVSQASDELRLSPYFRQFKVTYDRPGQHAENVERAPGDILCDDVGAICVEKVSDATHGGEAGAFRIFRAVPTGKTRVTLQLTGTATNGVDYEAVATSQRFGMYGNGDHEIIVPIIPIFDPEFAGPLSVQLRVPQAAAECDTATLEIVAGE